jgi:hypothetical protein
MTSTEFVYWLQGFLEIADPKKLTKLQIEIIKDHIALVMDKQTPIRISTPQIYSPPTLEPPHLPNPLITPICEGQNLDPFRYEENQLFCKSTSLDPNIEAKPASKYKRSNGLKC